jgi:hypothetical protein
MSQLLQLLYHNPQVVTPMGFQLPLLLPTQRQPSLRGHCTCLQILGLLQEGANTRIEYVRLGERRCVPCSVEGVDLRLGIRGAERRTDRALRSGIIIRLEHQHLPGPRREIGGGEVIIQPTIDGDLERTDHIRPGQTRATTSRTIARQKEHSFGRTARTLPSRLSIRKRTTPSGRRSCGRTRPDQLPRTTAGADAR